MKLLKNAHEATPSICKTSSSTPVIADNLGDDHDQTPPPPVIEDALVDDDFADDDFADNQLDIALSQMSENDLQGGFIVRKGIIFNTFSDATEFIKQYSKQEGFETCKSTVYDPKDKSVILRCQFFCNHVDIFIVSIGYPCVSSC